MSVAVGRRLCVQWDQAFILVFSLHFQAHKLSPVVVELLSPVSFFLFLKATHEGHVVSAEAVRLFVGNRKACDCNLSHRE